MKWQQGGCYNILAVNMKMEKYFLIFFSDENIF